MGRKSTYVDRVLDDEHLARKIDADGPHIHEEGGAHVSVAMLEHDSPEVVAARSSKAIAKDAVLGTLSNKDDYADVLAACIRNAKIGPFTATSGVILPFYLNAPTNFLDKTIAPAICRLTLDVLAAEIKTGFSPNNILVVGMESAGGIMVSQLAAVAAVTHPKIAARCDFVYCRKRRKGSGTCQQLEGPQFITSRTSDSEELEAIWLDDVNSTGSSLRDGVLLLKRDYNVAVKKALYLVDRPADRAKLAPDKLGLADPAVAGIDVLACFDLAPISAAIKEKMAATAKLAAY